VEQREVDRLWDALRKRCCASKPYTKAKTIVMLRKADLAAVLKDPQEDVAMGKEEAVGKRAVFREEGASGQRITLIARGSVTNDLLDALDDYVKHQRKRLARAEADQEIRQDAADAGEKITEVSALKDLQREDTK
jgi:hypothetical protein